ncbi:MAG TPA: flagellar filament capping protein FliD [Acidobacteriaceae bacterium]|nr:flagellar filament capping protein FliD [Acidobacteriaceae bacterium]
MSSISALNSLLGSSSSSSSIDLSAILEAAMGASTPGIDVTSAVNAAVTAAEAPENAWESQQYTLESQISALTQIQTDATNLDNDMQSLNSVTGPLSARTVTSSNSNVVSATAASGSTIGNHVVVVNSLASTASWTSGTFATGSTVLPAGTITITPSSGTATTITTDGSSTTLSDVASQINSDNLGVTASVITDATGARLAIVSNTSGSAANFTVSSSDPTGYGFSQAVTGANASLTVDGISLSSASNTVTGAVPGLTLNLLSTSTAPVSLGVAQDTSQASTAINQFVTDYNTAIQDLNSQFTFSTSTSSEGPLATDSVVRNLQSAMMQAVDYTYTPSSGTTTMPNLTSMGITVNNDGTLSVDSGTLTSALENNFSDVQNFFQGSALNGFANSLDSQLTTYLAPGDGAFTVDLQSMNSEVGDLQTDITNFQTDYITPLQTQLQSEYSQAEILLQQLPTEMQQINTELGLNNSSNG